MHENLEFYKIAKVMHKKPVCIEFFNIMLCDEVWIFDNGYDNYPVGGRLDERLRDLGVSVKFLCRVDNTWDFYAGRDSSYNEESDKIVDDYYLIGEMLDNNAETDKRQCCCTGRKLSRGELSEREYDLAIEALCLSHMIMFLETKGAVRQDDSLVAKANQYLDTVNEVLLGILSSEDVCDESLLRTYSAKNDFTKAELELLAMAYDV